MRSHRCSDRARPTPVPSMPVCSSAEAVEGLEHAVQVLGADAAAGVGNREPHEPRRQGRARQVDAPTGVVVLDRVGQQVQEHLHEALPVGGHDLHRRGRSTEDRMTTSARAAMGLVSSSASDTISSTRTGVSVSSR